MIGDCAFNRYLCDLGSSVNLMPYSVFKRLGLGDISPTTLTLQLADRSVKRPVGIIEDVLIKVDKFIFPVDFIVLDFNADVEAPLILGRPFMNTSRALVDVHDGKLTLRVGEDSVDFNVQKSIKQYDIIDPCMRIDVIDDCFNAIFIEDTDVSKSLENGVKSDANAEIMMSSIPLHPSITPTPPSLKIC